MNQNSDPSKEALGEDLAWGCFGDESLLAMRRLYARSHESLPFETELLPPSQVRSMLRAAIARREQELGISTGLRQLARNQYTQVVMIVDTNRAVRESEVYDDTLARKLSEGLPVTVEERAHQQALVDQGVDAANRLYDYQVENGLPPYIEPPAPTDNP